MNEKNTKISISPRFSSRKRSLFASGYITRRREGHAAAETTSVSICEILVKRPPMMLHVSVRANTCVRERMHCNDVFIGRRSYPPSFVFVSHD